MGTHAKRISNAGKTNCPPKTITGYQYGITHERLFSYRYRKGASPVPVTQNMQVHTVFSSCAKREMEIPAIFEEAHAHGLELIAFTDHLNTPEQWDIPSRVRE